MHAWFPTLGHHLLICCLWSLHTGCSRSTRGLLSTSLFTPAVALIFQHCNTPQSWEIPEVQLTPRFPTGRHSYMVTLSSFCQPFGMKRKWSPMFSCDTDLGDPECDQGTKHVTLLNLVFIKYVSTISSTQSPEGRSFQDRVGLAPFFPKLLLGGLYLVMSVSSKLLKFKAKKSLISFLWSHLYLRWNHGMM